MQEVTSSLHVCEEFRPATKFWGNSAQKCPQSSDTHSKFGGFVKPPSGLVISDDGLLQERIQIKISQEKKCTGQSPGEGPSTESGRTAFPTARKGHYQPRKPAHARLSIQRSYSSSIASERHYLIAWMTDCPCDWTQSPDGLIPHDPKPPPWITLLLSG